MTPTEALKILGLWPTLEQVKAAFAVKVKEVHPDLLANQPSRIYEQVYGEEGHAGLQYKGQSVAKHIELAKQARDVLLPKLNFASTNPCPMCRGSGRVAMRECSSCRGTGERQ